MRRFKGGLTHHLPLQYVDFGKMQVLTAANPKRDSQVRSEPDSTRRNGENDVRALVSLNQADSCFFYFRLSLPGNQVPLFPDKLSKRSPLRPK